MGILPQSSIEGIRKSSDGFALNIEHIPLAFVVPIRSEQDEARCKSAARERYFNGFGDECLG